MPYLDAEVIYAARYEWAVQADDIIARRTRLAFLNKDAAIAAIPRCVALGCSLYHVTIHDNFSLTS